jgi:hypothetical protein
MIRPAELGGKQACHHEIAQRMRNKDRAGVLKHRVCDFGLPGFWRRVGPIVLIDGDGCRIRRLPPGLTMRIRRAVDAGKQQGLRHVDLLRISPD